jgi:predicted ferric reductase
LQLLALLCLTAILSFLYFRRKFYEIFKVSHSFLVVGIAITLWYHLVSIDERDFVAYALLIAISVVWVLNGLLNVFFLFKVNVLRLRSGRATSLDPYRGYCYRVRFTIDSKQLIQPGQYFNFLNWRRYGWIESHPYMILWSAMSEDQQKIDFLIKPQKGFSERYRRTTRKSNSSENEKSEAQRIALDGPYGFSPDLYSFDIVLFLAEGIGITSQLFYMKRLQELCHKRQAKVRRISLGWKLSRIGRFPIIARIS